MKQNVGPFFANDFIYFVGFSFSGKKHYNEFHAVKMARALMNESEDEEDDKSVDELGKVSDDPDVSGSGVEDVDRGEKSKAGRGSGSNSPMDTEPIV